MHTLVMFHRRRDLQIMASEVGISFRAVQSILTNILGMSKVSARWVLRILTDDQKTTGLDVSRISCLAMKMTLAIISREL